ncbi:MAG: lysophospholipid acyltransferase family protein [Paludibacteraceae bacterium]|nr:lysophospholipid acyltransferase family protein [Paludibacteraceae bacterium]MBQ4017740.1 lysophospholipid acyltransferase family protein [Paludibacteraceae bacterium]
MLLRCASALSRLPLGVLYAIADTVLFPVMYHVVRYRREVVQMNLRLAFPEKSEAERKQIAKAFYHQFCYTLVEILYGYHISDEEMRQRVAFENMEEVNRLVDAAGGGIFMLAHMGNWEWQASLQQWLSPGVKELNVYRKLKNPGMDKLMLAIREKRGGACVEKQRILREMVRYRAEHQPVIVGLLSDQKPRPEVTRTWLTFMHQETGFLDGGEMLGKKFGYPVFYVYITRTSKGHYRSRMEVLSADPKQTKEGEITTAYARAMERNIIEQPELWLWSHNRWKWHHHDGM